MSATREAYLYACVECGALRITKDKKSFSFYTHCAGLCAIAATGEQPRITLHEPVAIFDDKLVIEEKNATPGT